MFEVFGFTNEAIFGSGEEEAFYGRLCRGDYSAHHMCDCLVATFNDLTKAVQEAKSSARTTYFDGVVYIWDSAKKKWYDPEYEEYMEG